MVALLSPLMTALIDERDQELRQAEHDFEESLEAAYWEFDARHKGYARWKEAPMTERDAFKAAVRRLAKQKPAARLKLDHEQGPMLVTSNGGMFFLSLFDRILLRLDLTDASRLERKYTHTKKRTTS